MIKKTIALLALAAASEFSFAADVYVIAHSAVNTATDEVRDIFLGEKQIAGGTKVIPMDNSALQKEFLDKVIKLDATKYSSKKGFRDGLNPPPVKSGDAEVIAAVKATPGAIGYVSSAPAGVKVIQKY